MTARALNPRSGLAALLMLAVLAGAVVLTHNWFTTQFPGGNDSIPRYYGARAWLFEGLNPYSEVVSERGQVAIYGRLANDEGEDKARFAYPFFVIYFYLPLAPLSWEWARAAGMVGLQVALAATTVLSMRLYQWKPPVWMTALTALWAVSFYHGARTVLLGQFAGVSAALIVMGLWAIKARRHCLAGACFALATAKPQMTFVLVPLIGLWSLTARRWQLTVSLAASMVLLLGSSFLFAPTWLADMMGQVAAYQTYTDIGSPINTLTHHYFPFLGAGVEAVATAALLGWLIWEWWRTRRSDGENFEWAVALALVITNLIALRTATTNYVMMIPAVIYVFAKLGERRLAWIAIIQLALWIGLWALFAVTVQGRVEQPPMYLPMPLLLLGALIVLRPKGQRAGAHA